jgi:hypothetical protein
LESKASKQSSGRFESFHNCELAGETCQYRTSNGVLCWLYTAFESPFLGAVKVYLKQNCFVFLQKYRLKFFSAPKIPFSA